MQRRLQAKMWSIGLQSWCWVFMLCACVPVDDGEITRSALKFSCLDFSRTEQVWSAHFGTALTWRKPWEILSWIRVQGCSRDVTVKLAFSSCTPKYPQAPGQVSMVNFGLLHHFRHHLYLLWLGPHSLEGERFRIILSCEMKTTNSKWNQDPIQSIPAYPSYAQSISILFQSIDPSMIASMFGLVEVASWFVSRGACARASIGQRQRQKLKRETRCSQWRPMEYKILGSKHI